MERQPAVARLGIVAVIFAAFFVAFFTPALWNGNFLTDGGDGLEIALPFYTIPHGLWEPGIMLGYPWASNLNGYWDPLFALHWIPHSFNVYMLAAYVIAATGVFGLVDALTRSTTGGFVAGFSYALGGFMIGHLGHYDVVHPAAWAPFVLWAFIEVQRRKSLLPIALGALAIALCALAGQPQVLAYLLLLVTAYVVTLSVATRDGSFVLRGSATIGLGLALSAIVLVPGMWLALSSFRSTASLDYFLSESLPAWELPVRLFLPYFLGQSSQPLYPYSTIAVGSNTEFAGYVGTMTLTLAFVAILTRRADLNVRFFAFAAAAALLLSTGDGFHIAAITYHLPVLNLFRAQARHLVEFTLLAAVLAGIGAAEIARGNVSLRNILIPIALTALAFAAAMVEAVHSGARAGAANDPLTNPALFLPAVVFLGSIAVLALYQSMPASRAVAILVVAFTAADLSTFAWFQYWRSPANERMLQPPPELSAIRAELSRTHQRLFSVAGSASPGVGIAPNLSLAWGFPSAGGYVQLLLTAPGIFLQLYAEGTIADKLLFDGTDKSLDLAAIRYVVIAPERAAAFVSARPGWRVIQQAAAGAIVENTNASPRVRIVHRVVTMTPDAALAAIRHPSLDVRSVALVDGAALETPEDANDGAAITALDSDNMQVATTCRTDCFLETSDNYNSMWQATIDGQRAPLRLTDYTLRGVYVPAGVHTVTFAYRPWIIALGGGISCLAGGTVMLLAWFGVRRRKVEMRNAD